MTDDLVTRLKDGFAIRTVIGGYAPDIGGTVQIMAEAAARIESDAVTIARLEGGRDSASGSALTLQAECERLHGDVAAAEAKLAALVEAAQGMSTPIKNVDFETRLEQHGRLFAAIAAAKEGA